MCANSTAAVFRYSDRVTPCDTPPDVLLLATPTAPESLSHGLPWRPVRQQHPLLLVPSTPKLHKLEYIPTTSPPLSLTP